MFLNFDKVQKNHDLRRSRIPSQANVSKVRSPIFRYARPSIGNRYRVYFTFLSFTNRDKRQTILVYLHGDNEKLSFIIEML